VDRIGLFGGSFNPVHLGHLIVAQAAREELALDRIFFIPASQSPFKPDLTLAPAAERLRLLRLALAGQTGCAVDVAEIQRGGVSYSIDTVRAYRERYPGAALFYLIGADHLATLREWRAAEALAALVEFVVLPRPGGPVQPPPAPFRVRPLRGIPVSISSSEIRDRVRAGLPVDLLVGQAVAEAMAKNRLYV